MKTFNTTYINEGHKHKAELVKAYYDELIGLGDNADAKELIKKIEKHYDIKDGVLTAKEGSTNKQIENDIISDKEFKEKFNKLTNKLSSAADKAENDIKQYKKASEQFDALKKIINDYANNLKKTGIDAEEAKTIEGQLIDIYLLKSDNLIEKLRDDDAAIPDDEFNTIKSEIESKIKELSATYKKEDSEEGESDTDTSEEAQQSAETEAKSIKDPVVQGVAKGLGIDTAELGKKFVKIIDQMSKSDDKSMQDAAKKLSEANENAYDALNLLVMGAAAMKQGKINNDAILKAFNAIIK